MSLSANSLNSAPATKKTQNHPCAGGRATSTAGYGWLGFALLLFLLQAVPYLSHRWVTDESWYAGPAYSVAHGDGMRDPAIGPNDLENHFDARPPGTALVIAAFFKLLGAGQVTARLGSVLAGLGIVFLTYRLTRDVLGEEGAAIATLLAATDNLVVLTSRSARPEALTAMFILLSMLAMKQYAKRGSTRWALFSGLLIAMGTMFHITLLGYIVSFGLLAIVIDRMGGRFPLRGGILYTLGFFAGLAPFAVWILTAPLGRAGFRQEYMGRAVHDSLLTKFIREGHRYSDIFGFNMIHSHGLETIPVRLPIPLFFLAATFLLWKFRRSWFYLELLLLVPSVLWLIYTVNKSSRYIAIIAPLFAMAIGAAVAATRKHRLLHRAVVAVACLVIVAQVGANFILLNAARKADYNKVGAELRSVVPPGETAYGTITFWLAFRGRPFISYERTDPWMAANQYHTRYFILGDRTMSEGWTGDSDFYTELNQHLAEITARSELVGHFPDPYYGDLKVYRLDN